MAITATQVKQAQSRKKGYKLSDTGGLYLLVQPNGGKYWRLNFRFSGKQKTLAFGRYPLISLKEARAKRDDARRQLSEGIDPAAAKQAVKQSHSGEDAFEAIAREWFGKYSPNWAPRHADRVFRLLERDLFPWLGQSAIDTIDAPTLLQVLHRIESRGALETAHRAKQRCGMIFRYAIATGRAKRDPTADLKGALPPVKPKHFATITDPQAIGQLLRAIDGYRGHAVTRCALQLAPLVFVRPGELRGAQWSEINLDAAEWRIPAQRMKMDDPHVVPLSRQAGAVLSELHAMTGLGRYVFPSIQSRSRQMSDNTVLSALRRLGYSGEEMTGHGFRSMASTLLNEQGFNRDHIEIQLAHSERDSSRASYNFAQYLPERRRMMQHWADYLDGLRSGADVVSLRAQHALSG